MLTHTDKTKLFISKAYKIHKNRYDYSKVNYINAKTKITIICREHGEFTQIPDFHINRKCGCPKCSNNVKLDIRKTQNIFICKNNEYIF